MYNVLVCDDDKAILESIRIYLDNEDTMLSPRAMVPRRLKKLKATIFTALCLIL